MAALHNWLSIFAVMKAAGDRVTGAVIDEIILSNGSDIVNVEGSAFGAGTQQVLRLFLVTLMKQAVIRLQMLCFKMLKLLGSKTELNTISCRVVLELWMISIITHQVTGQIYLV